MIPIYLNVWDEVKPCPGSISKSFIVLFFILVFFSPVSAVSAQVMMTEIMYDLEGTDTGREWIELYNTGSSGVDLADWKLFEGNTNHRLTAQDASVIPAQGFAIIADNLAKFLTDNPNFSGVLFDSTFSLSNEGEALILRDGSGTDIDSVTYSSSMGATGDGNSLQKSGSEWVAALPTVVSIGLINSSQSIDSSTTTEDSKISNNKGGSHGSYASQFIANESADNAPLEVSSGRDRLGFVGTPLSFEARVKSPKNLQSIYVSHQWSMGDGTKKSGQFISHTYVYPGEYIVILNSEHGGDRAVSKVMVRIVSPQVSIREVNDDFIEIVNDGIDELNLGSWSIETHGGRFVIPQDTIVLPKKSIRLPSGATRIKPVNTVSLTNPSSVVLAQQMVLDVSLGVDTSELTVFTNGLTEDMIRENFAIAMASRYIKSDVTGASVVTSEEPMVKMVEKVKPLSTSTQVAGVIYTVGQNTKTRGFFSKLFDFFRR